MEYSWVAIAASVADKGPGEGGGGPETELVGSQVVRCKAQACLSELGPVSGLAAC